MIKIIFHTCIFTTKHLWYASSEKWNKKFYRNFLQHHIDTREKILGAHALQRFESDIKQKKLLKNSDSHVLFSQNSEMLECARVYTLKKMAVKRFSIFRRQNFWFFRDSKPFPSSKIKENIRQKNKNKKKNEMKHFV